MVADKMKSSYFSWIIFLTYISVDITSSQSCSSLTIKCNSGSPNCYSSSAPQCGIVASHLVGRNRLPPTPTAAPTTYMLSNHPTLRPTNNPILGPYNSLPTNPPVPTTTSTTQPTNYPTTTKTPTSNPLTRHPTIAPIITASPTYNPPTFDPTERPTITPTEHISHCITCDCDCSICTQPEQCMRDGPNCIWFSRLTPSCMNIYQYLSPTNQPTNAITVTPTTLLPTTSTSSTTTRTISTSSTATSTTLSPTIAPPTSTTVAPATILPISCADHFINGLYTDEAVIFEIYLSSSQTVIFDACHSDLVPVIRLLDDNTNEVLNECNLVNGCCALTEHDSGLITDLVPGLYHFEFGFDPQDRLRWNKDVAIWHIHIECHDINIPSPVIGSAPTQIITPQPTTTTLATLSPTTNSDPTQCNLCSCDCSLCIEPEQCMSSGPNCIWLKSICIQIAASPTTTTSKPSIITTTSIPTSAPVTRLPTAATCPQLGETCTSAHDKDVRCCYGDRELGYARCYYMEYDANGHKIGTCCVRANRPGCNQDADCCGSKRGCYDGFCLAEPVNGGTAAIHISENGEYAEWVTKFDDDGKVFGLSRASRIVGIIVLVIFVVCNLIYCYFKYCRERKRNEEDDSDAETHVEDVNVIRI